MFPGLQKLLSPQMEINAQNVSNLFSVTNSLQKLYLLEFILLLNFVDKKTNLANHNLGSVLSYGKKRKHRTNYKMRQVVHHRKKKKCNLTPKPIH